MFEDRILISLTVCFILSGCGILSSRPDKPEASEAAASNVEVRDVPMQARGILEAPRHRVLVLPFLDERVEKAANTADVARNTVVRELLATRQFVVVSPSDFPQDLKTFLTEEYEYDMDRVAKAASALGVSAVIEGKVLSIRARKQGDSVGLLRSVKAEVAAQVRVRVHAGRTGKELMNEMRSAEADTSITEVAERGDIVSRLSEDPHLVAAVVRKAFLGSLPNVVRAVEKLSWEGRVAMVTGERIYVNAGRLSGIQVGDILKVTEEGEDVYDPETGRFIGRAPGRLKGTIEVISYFGKDGAIGIIHSGSGFQENDRVEIY